MVLASTGLTQIMHVKGHSRANTEEARWNNLVDEIAKQVAFEDPQQHPSPSPSIYPIRTRMETAKSPPFMDLGVIQANDEIEQLLNAGKDPSGKYQIQRRDGIIWAIYAQGNQHWVVPKDIRRDLIQNIHEQGHHGKELTLNRVEETGWWPGQRQEVFQ